jgi:hypothetical protein
LLAGRRIPIRNEFGRAVQHEFAGLIWQAAPRYVWIESVFTAKALDRGVLNVYVLVILGSPKPQRPFMHSELWVGDKCALIDNPRLTGSPTRRTCAAFGVVGGVEAESVIVGDGIHRGRIRMNAMYAGVESICIRSPQILVRFFGELDKHAAA